MQNEIVLRFGIWGFTDITHDEITRAMGINPSKIYVKGQRKNPDPRFPALAKQNGWLIEPSDRYLPFEVQLKNLLQILEARLERIKDYCLKYTCEISCGVFVYFENGESPPSIHLNSEYNRIVKELNLDFDVDIYCLPN